MNSPRTAFSVRNARSDEFKQVGDLLVNVYSKIEGFPTETDQPEYYKLLHNAGELARNKNTEILIAVNLEGAIGGAVVYINDMKDYGSGGIATMEKNACGFRLLAVNPDYRNKGIGKKLTLACIEKGKLAGLSEMIIHSTESMQIAWKMYEKMGFKRSADLDFMQEKLPVFGFRLRLNKPA